MKKLLDQLNLSGISSSNESFVKTIHNGFDCGGDPADCSNPDDCDCNCSDW